ncbi:metal-dependent hydrolase [Pseudomonas sp. QC2]|uniref:M48 family metallopeptidase n=1 Tax=Pseudomonas sp. QC2 TaxID=2065822 RepID=UPI000C7D1CA5|nr:SprT family zinc-dependent metalloprotease [Pseudomonas sp. QC2]PLR64534.1 metal-dependent hydrolase [Pseudomonas sp. QC2]
MEVVQIGSLVVELHRKAIKNLHISVLPPEGRVRVSAPEHLSDTALRTAVIHRLAWIRRQQRDFTTQPRQTERKMVSGETHYLWGRRYRLDVIERAGKTEIKLSKTRIRFFIRPEAGLESRIRILNEWYRCQLKERVQVLIGGWQEKLGVVPSFWGVKKMKTKWGSCNTQAKRIWLNLELSKKSPECLEFILVHELVHLLERHHNHRFSKLIDGYLPRWRESRALLNSSPLVYDKWAY